MNHLSYSQSEFNALMDEAKVRAAQLRREAIADWGSHLVRIVQGLTSQAK